MGEGYLQSDGLTMKNPWDWSSTEIQLPQKTRPKPESISAQTSVTSAVKNLNPPKLNLHPKAISAQKLLSPSELINAKQIKPPTLKPLPSTEKISNWGKFKQGANKAMNSKAANYAMLGIDTALGFMGDNDKDINSWDATTKQLRRGIENGLISSGNPWLMAAGLASKGFGKLGMYGDATKGLGTGNDIINTLGAFIPGVGWFAGKSKEIQKDEQVQASTGYTGVTNDVNKAAQNAGGRFLAGMGKQNARRDRAQLAQEQAHEVLENNKLALQNSGNPLYQLKTQVLTSGGYNTMSGKNGAKLYNLQEAKRILSNRLQLFKQGGAVNVIPDGALHKNRHHLEDIDEKFEDVTTKGIPVITEAKNGDIIQQAEVEKEEIIFNLEVTKKLEELMEKDTDEAAIEAGKLLTEEILRNTIDNTKKLL